MLINFAQNVDKTNFILQKKVVRAFTFNNFAALSTPIFSELKVLRLYDWFYSKLLSFVYEYVNKILPFYFHDYFCCHLFINMIPGRHVWVAIF